MPSWERLLTEVFQPPFVLSAMFLILPVITSSSWRGAAVGIVPAVLVCLGPLLVVVVLGRKGRLSGHHVANRKQRAPVMTATFSLAAASVFILRALSAPMVLLDFLLAAMAAMITLAVVSPWWKISGHAMTLAGSLTVLTVLLGYAFLPAALLLPCVGAARVRLGDHTPSQVVVGSILGVFVIGGVFHLFHA